MKEDLLTVRGITKTYPGVIALNNVSMSFRKGEVHGIVGENGAGKSTLIKTITGAIVPDSGEIIFDGKTYDRLDPIAAISIGIGVVYQEFNLIPGLTVAENVFLGKKVEGTKYLADFKTMNRRTKELGERIGVKLDGSNRLWELSVAQQQIVEITRALAENVKLLIMDEPSAPLTNVEIEKMFEIIKMLKEQGVTIIYISHRMDEIFRITDRVSVMMDGKYINTVNTCDTNRQQLINMMVGRELKETFPERITPVGEEVLRAEHLSGKGVRDVSFTLHKGEILGFAGLMGCGRTETMELIFGARERYGGELYLKGKKVNFRNTEQALNSGIALVPEDRKGHGIFPDKSIKWNSTISCIKALSKFGVVNLKKEKETAKTYIDAMRIKTPSDEQLVKNLSGGNQQKVVVAKVLATKADIIIFDEPTRGIDVGAKQEIYALIRQLAETGISVLMISSELEEVIGLSDRIVVLSHGKVTTILEQKDFAQTTILDYASMA